MTRRTFALMTTAAAVLGFASVACADSAVESDEQKAAASGESAAKPDPADARVETKARARRSARMPVFAPPNRGVPASRVGGATRGIAADPLPRIEALVPEEPGLTLESQPLLYWYASRPSTVRVDLRIIEIDPIKPVLETTIASPKRAGIQRIRLSEHGVELRSGVAYQWYVSLVPKPDDRSYDRMVGGGIQRIDSSDELRRQLEAADAEEAVFVLADEGIWYDAVAALSVQIAANPGDAILRAQRAALFDQVGLPTVVPESMPAVGLGAESE
jgi:hypothetical protein